MCFNIIQHYLFVYHVIFVIFLYIYFNVTAINLIYKNTNDAITFYICYFSFINPLKTKRRLLYLRTQFVLHSKHFHLGYKNQSVYAVSGTSRCLFSDKYKTHKYSVGRVYNCWILNCWCITWPVGFKRLIFWIHRRKIFFYWLMVSFRRKSWTLWDLFDVSNRGLLNRIRHLK